jgi:hypothetical protein
MSHSPQNMLIPGLPKALRAHSRHGYLTLRFLVVVLDSGMHECRARRPLRVCRPPDTVPTGPDVGFRKLMQKAVCFRVAASAIPAVSTFSEHTSMSDSECQDTSKIPDDDEIPSHNRRRDLCQVTTVAAVRVPHALPKALPGMLGMTRIWPSSWPLGQGWTRPSEPESSRW